MVSFSKTLSTSVCVAISSLSLLFSITQGGSGKVSGNIDCLDAYACANESLVGDTNVYCYGYYSCLDTNLSVANSAHCSGDHACDNGYIRARKEITCRGLSGCEDVTITDSGTKLSIDGPLGFYKGLLNDKGSDAVECNGFGSCLDSKLYKTDNLYVDGAYGFALANIYSNDINYLNIYFNGIHASYGSSIYCTNNSICNINCGSDYGCSDNTTIYCYSGSDCNYDCNDCATDSCPTVHDEDDDNTWKLIYPNIKKFEHFIKVHEANKLKIKTKISTKRNEYKTTLGLNNDAIFIDWLKDYLRFINPNDILDEDLNEQDNYLNGIEIHRNKNKYRNRNNENDINNENAAIGGIVKTATNSGIFNYSIIQIAALCSVIVTAIIGFVYWYCKREKTSDYQMI